MVRRANEGMARSVGTPLYSQYKRHMQQRIRFFFLLQSEQIHMGAGSVQLQLIAILFVYEQPVRLYVAFPVSGVIAAQVMVPVFCRQRSGDAEGVNRLLQ